ncbi:hypothetical protein ACJZ2D_013116 [Fusarium nematophilum]
MAQSGPIPIIVCGKTEAMGRGIIEALKPEIEVIHFVLPGESGPAIIPAILAGHPPPSHPERSSIGSGNYSEVPRAILFGGAYDDVTVAHFRDVAKVFPGARSVPWVRQDKTRDAPPVTSPEYPKVIVQRSKDALLQLQKDGKLDGTHGELEWY